MDHIEQIQHLHWTVWGALGFSIGLGLLLLGMRILDSFKGQRSGTLYDIAFKQRIKETAQASKSRNVLVSDANAAAVPVSGRVVECSVAGISLRVPESVDAGTILSFRPVDVPAAFGWASVEVKEANQDGPQWKLGCRFIRTPPWVTRFLADPAA